MGSVWLLLHYNSKDFDVRVEDTDLCHLMGLYEDVKEESAKQDVYLPKAFRLVVHNPRTNRKMEIESDKDLERVWSFGRVTDTIEIWVEETNNPRIVFRAYVQLREQTEKEKLENIRRVQEILRKEQEEEERRQAKEERKRKEEDEEREAHEARSFCVAIEVSILSVDDVKICKYMRVFETEGADECCPGPSQPTASPSVQPTAPPTPTKQPTPPTPSPSKQHTPPHSPPRAQTPPPSPPREPIPPPSPPREPTPPPSLPTEKTHTPSPPREPTPPPSPATEKTLPPQSQTPSKKIRRVKTTPVRRPRTRNQTQSPVSNTEESPLPPHMPEHNNPISAKPKKST
ncbi:vegetative cell wall protein gp1-like [Beta vulgaris subsp. vulgaris]|uniref:vegetative cell wall protein gp1-like n=1 Tax=Beta vulgaris subsp. vulgaris TaxID=3555 RepID=UPI0025492846|nr:vegetative cell wall protein gp1-like [Beta vulgaris subsp. vulgaris]